MAPAPASPYLFARGRVFYVLFQEFKVESGATLILCLVISFSLATSTTLVSEGFLRNPNRGSLRKVLVCILRFFLHYVTTMLVLTMNIPIFLAILLGHAFGYVLSFVFFPQLPSPGFPKNDSSSAVSIGDRDRDELCAQQSSTLDYLLTHGFSINRNSAKNSYTGISASGSAPCPPVLPVFPPPVVVAAVKEEAQEAAPAPVRDCLRPHGLSKGGVGDRLEATKKSALRKKKSHLLAGPRRSSSARNFDRNVDDLGPKLSDQLSDLRHIDSTDFAIPSFHK